MFFLQFPLPLIESRFSPYKWKPVVVPFYLDDQSHSSSSSTISGRRDSSQIFLSHPKSSYASSPATEDVAEDVEEEAKKGRIVTETGVQSEELSFPAGLTQEYIPNHVAVIMDGNVRWARQRGLPSSSGHQAGVRALKDLVQLCCKWGIRVLTVFAFSCDNWVRPQIEVNFLMKLFEKVIEDELENFMRDGIRVSVVGNPSKLPISLQKLITRATEITKNNSRVQLIVAVNYTGRYDIIQACQSIAHKVKDGLIDPEDINETLIAQELETNCTDFPYPDLLIRTSGELRISNFMLWQLAYTEFFFVQSLWPDFGENEFAEALHSFEQRQRRYGGRNS